MRNIIIFGDSISSGRKVNKVQSWPMLLASEIDKHDKDLTVVYNLSIIGDNSSHILDRIAKELPQDALKDILAIYQ